MKKVKIMLASLAMVAVIGSSLAFKAKRFGATVYTGTAANSCPTALTNFAIDEFGTPTIWVTDNALQTDQCISAALIDEE